MCRRLCRYTCGLHPAKIAARKHDRFGSGRDSLKYRKFGSQEWKASILGLGTERLPAAGRGRKRLIDARGAIEVIRGAIDRGVNYLDLGYPYECERQESVAAAIRDALQDGYSERVRTALTLPTHLIRFKEDFDTLYERQLAFLGMERTDFCLFGRLNRENWPVLQSHGALEWADEALKNGWADGIGFSFHDHFQPLKTILASYDRWALCQFQFSYMDEDHDPGISGIRHAGRKGLAVVLADPLRDGRLAGTPPDEVAEVWAQAGELHRMAEWGLRFAWNRPEAAVVVCDIGSLNELAETARIADGAYPDSLTVREELLIGRARDEWRKKKQILCCSCRGCMPCPDGIDVPRIFEIYNDAFIYDDVKTARAIYRRELHHAALCTRCGLCEDRCARKLPVLDWLDKARRLLET